MALHIASTILTLACQPQWPLPMCGYSVLREPLHATRSTAEGTSVTFRVNTRFLLPCANSDPVFQTHWTLRIYTSTVIITIVSACCPISRAFGGRGVIALLSNHIFCLGLLPFGHLACHRMSPLVPFAFLLSPWLCMRLANWTMAFWPQWPLPMYGWSVLRHPLHATPQHCSKNLTCGSTIACDYQAAV